MSYCDVSVMARDGHLRERIAACAAKEGVTVPQPTQWADDHQWQLDAQPGWGEARAYAREVGVIEVLGRDQGVISDGMILSAVQAVRAEAVGGDE